MLNLCEYKDMFGVPKKGIHSYRFMNIAIIDVLQTIVMGYFISYLLGISPYWGILGLFVLGILLHRLFCVRTTIDEVLFGS